MPMEIGRDGSWEPLSPSIKTTWNTRYPSMVSTTRTISWCKKMKFLGKTSNFYDKRQNKTYHMCVD